MSLDLNGKIKNSVSKELQVLYSVYSKGLLQDTVSSYNSLTQLKLEIEEKGFIDGHNLFNGYKHECNCKFVKKYWDGETKHFFDIVKFDEGLTSIQNNPRIYLINKTAILYIINFYFDLKILSGILNAACSYTQEKVKKNYLYFIIKEAIKPKKAKRKNIIQQIEYDTLYGQIKKNIDSITQGLINDHAGLTTKEQLQEMMLLSLSGEVKKIEKVLFPMLLDHITLFEETKKPGRYIPTKLSILFDLFPIIMPGKVFNNSESVDKKNARRNRYYNGNFYEYKVATGKSIFGI